VKEGDVLEFFETREIERTDLSAPAPVEPEPEPEAEAEAEPDDAE
jgi:hypothetical protein